VNPNLFSNPYADVVDKWRLEHFVDHDFLTALFNGRRFEQALAQETKSAARYGGGGAVLLLDLDHFKAPAHRPDLCATMSARARRSSGRHRGLVGIELVDVPYLTEGPPHLLHHLHLFERSVQRIGGGAHRIHHG
jgi:hypothetical protein